MKQRIVRDVSSLPQSGFGPRTTPWWGTLGFVAIEAMGFALVVATYLYLVYVNAQWPIGQPPDHWAGTAMTVLLLVSVLPNKLANNAARRNDLRATQRWLVVMSAIGMVTLAIRAYEFTALNIRWDDNAYGSVLWVTLGLHATHLITDVADTLVLAALMFTRHATKRRFSDVTDNVFYWYFVVVTWLPIYLLVYWVPRWGA